MHPIHQRKERKIKTVFKRSFRLFADDLKALAAIYNCLAAHGYMGPKLTVADALRYALQTTADALYRDPSGVDDNGREETSDNGTDCGAAAEET